MDTNDQPKILYIDIHKELFQEQEQNKILSNKD